MKKVQERLTAYGNSSYEGLEIDYVAILFDLETLPVKIETWGNMIKETGKCYISQKVFMDFHFFFPPFCKIRKEEASLLFGIIKIAASEKLAYPIRPRPSEMLNRNVMT